MALAPWSEQSRCAGVGGLPYHRAAEAERGNAQASGGMHVLARGDLLQRLRLASGLVLLTFAATHFVNHALGLVSLEAMQGMQGWRKVVTRSWLGSGVLLAAFLTHIALALYKISRRLTWKLPFWEAAQILTGLSHPALSRHAHHLQPRRGESRRHRRHLRLRARQHLAGARLGALAPPAGGVGARLHRPALLAEPRAGGTGACSRCWLRSPLRFR